MRKSSRIQKEEEKRTEERRREEKRREEINLTVEKYKWSGGADRNTLDLHASELPISLLE